MISISENIKQVKDDLEQKLSPIKWKDYEKIVFVFNDASSWRRNYVVQIV